MNYLSNNWRVGLCCQFHDSLLKNKANIGTTTRTTALNNYQKCIDKAVDNCQQLINFFKIISKLPINKRCFRISSTLFPCYTVPEMEIHYKNNYHKLSNLLSIASKLAIDNDIRLSMHPDQFCVLASDKIDVVKNSIKEFEYHATIGQMLLLDPNLFSINVHLQGKYGISSSKPGIDRFAANVEYLSDYARKCLSIENEDKPNGYDIYDTINLATKINSRCTLDVHHFECFRKKNCKYPSISDDYFISAVNTWKGVRPLFHVSHTKIDENGKDISRMNQHSDILHDSYRLDNLMPMLTHADFDIEAKHKEIAQNLVYKHALEFEDLTGEPIIKIA